jgi:SAM-dependent methyltransferase
MKVSARDQVQNSDHKDRWGGWLEVPIISRVQRALLDSGRVAGLAGALKDLNFETVADIGCGLGEGYLAGLRAQAAHPIYYVGVDNSLVRIRYATRRFPQARFLVAEAYRAPLTTSSCDLVLLIDTSHHLPDDVFMDVLREMARISRRYAVISDPVRTKNQSGLSRFFYGLDRGSHFRSSEQVQNVILRSGYFSIQKVVEFATFPGLYQHAAHVVRVQK